MSLSKLLATVIFLSASPLISVPDAAFATLSRRGTPKDILRGGGKRHACLTTVNRRYRFNHHHPTRSPQRKNSQG
ncbi:hypothetical protein [Chamaesiphon sp. GL140_3_metabinner_50]|uniref:hypothetical protein n=1 Tax=Chamaesiphon sp. GL140_3_metabinner_50 TaxID=2970812 RepID=UPI0025F473DE|nr:hypothetical protein [Chamaesiphon sp. GL140_3_metabinner_50]